VIARKISGRSRACTAHIQRSAHAVTRRATFVGKTSRMLDDSRIGRANESVSKIDDDLNALSGRAV